MKEQEVTTTDVVREEKEQSIYPLIESWIKKSLSAFQTREVLAAAIERDDIQTFGDKSVVADMELPSVMLPVMKLWASDGPKVLTSYSHPEQFETYKFLGNLNLSIFIKEMAKRGINIPTAEIVENWYETVDLDKSVTTPLKLGGIIPLDVNLFGLSGSKRGTDPFPRTSGFEVAMTNPDSIAQRIMDRLNTDFETEFNAQAFGKSQKKTRREDIRKIIAGRINTLLGLADECRSDLNSDARVNNFLFNMEQGLGGLITSGAFGRLEHQTGIQGTLSSKNLKLLGLHIKSLGMLGPEPIKRMVDQTGQGLFVGQQDGRTALLTVDKNSDKFIVLDRGSFETLTEIPDEELINFVTENDFQPLAKPETLVVVASGMVAHMGSEHGNRDTAIRALGVSQDRFANLFKFLSTFRIGEDTEQGNRLFTISGTNQSISASLAFVIFGEDFLKQKIASVAGKTSTPEELDDRQFKKLFARELAKQT